MVQKLTKKRIKIIKLLKTKKLKYFKSQLTKFQKLSTTKRKYKARNIRYLKLKIKDLERQKRIYG